MKRYFSKLFQFSLLALVLYVVGVLVWGSIPYSYIGSNFLYRQGAYGHLNTRVKEIPNYGDVDILFVGSSRVYRGFDPRIFEKQGVKIFVLGSSSQTPIQSYVLLKRYIDDLNPKLVVFDLLPSSFAIKGVEPTLDLLANDRIDYLSLEMALEENDLMVWNTFIYASIMQFFGVHNVFQERVYKPEERDTYISGGYVHKELKYNLQVECGNDSVHWEAPSQLQIKYFDKAKRLCFDIGAELLFINMPVAHYECFKNNKELIDLLGLTESLVDFNEILILDDSLHFYDDYHLNSLGLQMLNNNFIESVKPKF